MEDPKQTNGLKGLGIKTELGLSTWFSAHLHWEGRASGIVRALLQLCLAVRVCELILVPVLSCCLIKGCSSQ